MGIERLGDELGPPKFRHKARERPAPICNAADVTTVPEMPDGLQSEGKINSKPPLKRPLSRMHHQQKGCVDLHVIDAAADEAVQLLAAECLFVE